MTLEDRLPAYLGRQASCLPLHRLTASALENPKSLQAGSLQSETAKMAIFQSEIRSMDWWPRLR